MKQLIKITQHQTLNQVVSARELWEFLGVETRFNDWSTRMLETYGFEENLDYQFYSNLSKNTMGRPSKDYALTLDCAKEISMIQRTPKGKQARQYFLECEKKLLHVGSDLLNDKEFIKKRYYELLSVEMEEEKSWANELKQNILETELRIDKLDKEMNILFPSSIKISQQNVEEQDYRRLNKVEPFCPTEDIAKQLSDECGEKYTAQEMNSRLQALGIQHRVDDPGSDKGYYWELAEEYRNKGYQTYYQRSKHGRLLFAHWMRWTEPGAHFVIDKLKGELVNPPSPLIKDPNYYKK